MKIVQQSAVLEWITPDPLLVIERAGRTAYKSEHKIEPGSAERFVRMLLARGHESVIEHASASMRFVCDRGVSHELVRHRLCAFTQESTRYCDYTDEQFGGEISVVEPPSLDPGQRAAWMDSVTYVEAIYRWFVNDKVKPQIARAVLPTCLKTEIVCTANLREWRHILRLRTAPAAHPQMRELMLCAAKALHDHVPVLFDEFVDVHVAAARALYSEQNRDIP